MANYLSLEEAAKKLGISADRLVDLRSQGKVRGFRDGASWKFPEDAVDQLAEDLAGEIDPPSSSDDQMESGDLLMESEGDNLLEIDSGELKMESPAIVHDSEEIDLSADKPAESGSGASSLELMDELDVLNGSGEGEVSSPSSGVLGELDLLGADDKNDSGLISGDSGLLADASSKEVDDALDEDDDLVISADDDDLMLGSAGSDISIAGDSGINLMSPPIVGFLSRVNRLISPVAVSRLLIWMLNWQPVVIVGPHRVTWLLTLRQMRNSSYHLQVSGLMLS